MLVFNTFAMRKDEASYDFPFVIACKDRQRVCEDRWVVSALSEVEAKEVYEYLKQHYEKTEG